jgi:hypothetical protein
MAPLDELNQTPMQSKKFIAFFLCLVLSRVGIVVMVKADTSDIVIIAALLCATFVDVGYILGQAALDIYVRGIARARGEKTETET